MCRLFEVRAMDTELSRIADICKSLRLAIESAPANSKPISFRNFPFGSCRDTCLMLATLFQEEGVVGFKTLMGERGIQCDGSWSTHAWLDREGLAVDITADQFVDAPSGIIVSIDSPWHRGFTITESEDCSLVKPQEGASCHIYDLWQFYQKLGIASLGRGGPSHTG